MLVVYGVVGLHGCKGMGGPFVECGISIVCNAEQSAVARGSGVADRRGGSKVDDLFFMRKVRAMLGLI